MPDSVPGSAPSASQEDVETQVQSSLDAAPCPDPERLDSYRQGKLQAAEMDALRGHVASCAECGRRISRASRPPRRQHFEQGTRVGRYVVVAKLGVGAMGAVYAAYDPELDRRIALKLLLHQGGDSSTRMLREAQALARLTHPNVVGIYDVGWHDGQVFIAMELVRGTTLRAWSKAAKRSWREVRDVLVLAGRGLAAAHAAGLVHRDFKPDNVLIGDDGTVKVTDFGIAHAITTEAPSGPESGAPTDVVLPRSALPVEGEHASGPSLSAPITELGAIVGTPGYMAAEQLLAAPTDARSDQFAFSVTLYEALYGKRPFVSRDLLELVEEVRRGVVQDLPAGAPAPVWLHRVVLRGLAVDPDARFPSMAAMLTALTDDPTVKRRRVAWTVAAVALLASATVVGVKRASMDPVCSGGQAAVGEVWNDAVRAKAAQAFSTAAKDFGLGTWARAESVLGAYAAAWTTAHTQTCEATRVRREQTEAVMTARMACLEQRRQELRALAQTFGEADRGVVEKSVEASRSLPPIAECADVTSLLTVVPLPADPARREAIRGLQQELASMHALVDSGRVKDAAVAAPGFADRAKATGYAPLAAEALLVLGRVQQRAGSKSDGAATLRSGFYLAEESRNEDLKVRMLLQLAPVLMDLNRWDDTRDVLHLADAAATRLTNPASHLADQLSLAAWLEVRQSHWPAAVAGFNQAVEAAERDADTPPLLRSRIYARAAAALSHVGKVSESLEMFDRAEATSAKELGPDHPGLVSILVNKSSTQAEDERYADALTTIDRALAIAARALPPTSSTFATLHLNRSFTLLETNRLEEGLEEAKAAEQLARASFGAKSQMAAVHGVNTVHVLCRQGHGAECVQGYRNVLAAYDATDPPVPEDHEWRGEVLASLGLAEYERKELRAAVPALDAGIAIYDKNPGLMRAPRRLVARASAALADARWETGERTARVVELARKAKQLFADLGDQARVRDLDAWIERHVPSP